MEKLQKKENFRFSGRATQMGFLLTSINGRTNGARCPCWIYAVNGKLADKGVSQMSVEPGDRIRWCYLKYEERRKCVDKST